MLIPALAAIALVVRPEISTLSSNRVVASNIRPICDARDPALAYGAQLLDYQWLCGAWRSLVGNVCAARATLASPLRAPIADSNMSPARDEPVSGSFFFTQLTDYQ
jgi:hypothetical protein